MSESSTINCRVGAFNKFVDCVLNINVTYIGQKKLEGTIVLHFWSWLTFKYFGILAHMSIKEKLTKNSMSKSTHKINKNECSLVISCIRYVYETRHYLGCRFTGDKL